MAQHPSSAMSDTNTARILEVLLDLVAREVVAGGL